MFVSSPSRSLQAAFLTLLALWHAGRIEAAGRTEVTSVYVAAKHSAAFEAAQHRGDRVETKLDRALTKAVMLLNRPGKRVVRVLIAAGQYRPKLGVGRFNVPRLTNPQGTLELLAGFDAQFKQRVPFRKPVQLLAAANRNGPILTFTRRSQAQRVVVSGFVFDAAVSNAYDPKDLGLRRSSSRTYPLMSFDNLLLEHLVVADNIFVNGPHGAFEPRVIPASGNTHIDIENNFFVNNLKPLKVGAGLSYRGNTVRSINLRHNTFVRNWPYNLDVNSSNIGAIELHNIESARLLRFEGNLFAFNVGGVFQHNWPVGRMPKVELNGNLFFRNGSLFDNDEPAAGVMVGKFGLNPSYIHLDLAGIRDELEYGVTDNVVAHPGFPVSQLWPDESRSRERLADATDAEVSSEEVRSDQSSGDETPDEADNLLRQLRQEDAAEANQETATDTESDDASADHSVLAPKVDWRHVLTLQPARKSVQSFGVRTRRAWGSGR